MKVFIAESSLMYENMWEDNGATIIDSLAGADLVQFTGGSDVSPHLYGEMPHPRTFSDPSRDRREAALFNKALLSDIPVAGICRGAQFVNVMCGGAMWQHVKGHAVGGTHAAVDTRNGNVYQVSSTHHQMMREGLCGLVWGVADIGEIKQGVTDTGNVYEYQGHSEDVEVVMYKKHRALCFQPHPEFFDRHHECQKWYMGLVNSLVNGED